MIVGERKPLPEILKLLDGFKKVLVLGCGTCVTVCMSGGEKEAKELASLLRLKGFDAWSATVERQCEPEFNQLIREEVEKAEVILSLACGVGVQALTELYFQKPVYPALNTTFMGLPVEQGLWEERCVGCGECVVHLFGGICPIARCAKSLLNGPCGGSKNGKCEVKPERDCAWQLIFERFKASDRVEQLLRIQPPKDWSYSRYGGHRKMVREDVRL